MPRTLRRLIPVAALALAVALDACRFGYGAIAADAGGASSGGVDNLPASGGAAASPSNDAGSDSGGAASGGGGAGGDLVNLVVTTAEDEADTGASPSSPGKTGFSLREAIGFANTQAGHQSISFDSGVTTIGLKS